MDLKSSDIGVIKSEPETIPEEGSSTSHCDAVLQYGIVKQEAKYTSAIKCEPAPRAEEEHAEECGAYFKIDIDYSDIKKECFVHQENIDQTRSKLLTSLKKHTCPRCFKYNNISIYFC